MMRPTWGRKTSTGAKTSIGTATLVNRATTPQNNNSRTNSPTPAQPPNAWTAKADERHSHDQFTHLLYTLLVSILLPHQFVLIVSESIHFIAYSSRNILHWHSLPFRFPTRTRISP